MTEFGNKEIMARNLQRLISTSGKTRQEICDALDIPYSTFSEWMNAKKYPRIDKIEKLARYFNVKKSTLVDAPDEVSERPDTPAPVYSKCALPEIPPYDGISPVAVKRLPVLGSIAGGEPIFMNEEMDIYVEVGANVHADFILKASGDSMINARIHDGDLVFIQATPQVENGQIAAVAIGDEATLKRFYYYPEAQQICLQAENPVYAPMIFIGEQLREVRVLGRAIAFQSDVR